MPATKEHFIFNPALFAAQGAGFTSKSANGMPEQVKPGLHIRAFFNPALGLPRAGSMLEIIRLTHGRAISNQKSLAPFIDGKIYPVKKPGLLIAGKERMRTVKTQAGKSVLAFEKTAEHLYNQIDPFMVFQAHNSKPKDEYIQKVLPHVLAEPRVGETQWMTAPACAVDITVNDYTPSPEIIMAGRFQQEHRLVIVRGFDWKGRLLAEDWIGHRTVLAPLLGNNNNKKRVELKTRAALRAAGIARVEITGSVAALGESTVSTGLNVVETIGSITGNVFSWETAFSNFKTKPLTIKDILWVYTDDYLQQRTVPMPNDPHNQTEGFWVKWGIPFGLPLSQLSDVASDYAYQPFVAGSLPQYQNFIQQFKPLAEFGKKLKKVYDCATAWDMWNVNQSGNSDGYEANLRVLGLTAVAMVDPLVARVLGTYYFEDCPDIAPDDGDYKIIWRNPPFFAANNQDALQMRSAGSWLHDLELAGLVMGAEMTRNKPLPAVPLPLAVDATTVPLSSKLLINASITITNSETRVKQCTDSIGYVVKRATRSESEGVATSEYINLADPNKKGLLPPLMFPIIENDKPYLGVLIDVFSRICKQFVYLAYGLFPYDMFGRAGTAERTPAVKAMAPEYPPPAPGNTSAAAERVGDAVSLAMKFFDPVIPVNDVYTVLPQFVEMTVFSQAVGGTWNVPVAGSFAVEVYEVNTALDQCALYTATAQWHMVSGKNELVVGPLTLVAAPAQPPQVHAEVVSLTDDATPHLTHTVQRAITTAAALGVGNHHWCVRFRSKGTSFSGAALYSAAGWAPAMVEIRPEAPLPAQPPLITLPQSSRPDRLGDSYYSLDLSGYISVGIKAHIYLSQYELLDPANAAGTDNEIMGKALTLARAHRRIFNRCTEAPVERVASSPFYAIKVRGDMQQVSVVAITGVSALGDEAAWDTCAVAVFRSPLVDRPPLFELDTPWRQLPQTNTLRVVARAGFDTAAPEGYYPFVQLYRKDATLHGNKVYCGQVAGTPMPYAGSGPQWYQFSYDDAGLQSWHKYDYEMRLCLFDAGASQYIRSSQPAQQPVVIAGSAQQSPLTGCTLLADLKTIDVQLLPGEYTVKLLMYQGAAASAPIALRVSCGALASCVNAAADAVTVLQNAGTLTVSYCHDSALTADMRCVVTVRCGSQRFSASVAVPAA